MQLGVNKWQQPAELQTSHLWWIEKQVCRLPYGFKPSQVGLHVPNCELFDGRSLYKEKFGSHRLSPRASGPPGLEAQPYNVGDHCLGDSLAGAAG